MDKKRTDIIKSEAAATADSTDGLIIKHRKGSNDTETTSSDDNRESWDNKAQYILAVVGFAVGLGNVWRFPYLAQKNGGGAFLIPYTIMLAIEGIPIFYLELALGQRLRKGAVGVWNDISPYLGGIGIASAIVSFWVGFYYNTIIAWCLYYLVQSFMSPLPWAECPTNAVGNVTVVEEECKLSSPTTYFWYQETLNISDDVADGGNINWWIVVSLLVAWIIVFVCIFKGIASSGKVVYFTATFPYLVLVIFFFRGVTLDGFHHGVHHFFVPDFGKLVDPQVWLDAATQIFFSLGLAFGGLIAFASYMPVRNNCFKDAVLVSVVNCGTSVFAGVVVFSILGFKATQSFNSCMAERNSELNRLFNTTEGIVPAAGTMVNFTMHDNDTNVWYTVVGKMPELPTCDLKKEIEESASGTGLVFMAFTEAINQFPVAQLWSVLFFLMLLTLGLDSMFGMVESVVTSLMDLNLIPKAKKWHYFTGICGGSFVMSLCFANQAGAYIFTLFDEYSGNIPLLIIALSQVIAISYIYGLKRFSDDIELMTGQRPNWYWLACWKYISPLAMTVILLASIGNMFSGTTYEAWQSDLGVNVTKAWPWWCKFLAAFLILTPTLWIPGVAIVKYLRLYNWSQTEPANFPREQLEEELALKKTYNHRPISNFRSKWERKLFYWMPLFGVGYENEDTIKEDITAVEENASIDSGEESPC